MPEQIEIVKRKYGEGYETKYGFHYRLTIDYPLVEITQKFYEGDNPYIKNEIRASTKNELKTRIHRVYLEELIPFINMAEELGHEWEIDWMDDGRSDPRGYRALRPADLRLLIQLMRQVDSG